MNQKTVERPSLLTLRDLLATQTGANYKEYTTHGVKGLNGPCPECGGVDRFCCWVGEEGILHWSCRYCPKPQTEKKLFEILGLEWDGYTPHKPAKKIIPPVPDETMLANVKIDYRKIEQWHAHGFDKALAYFEPFGIDICTADDFMLGYLEYDTDDGKHFAGFTIPAFYPVGGKLAVKSVHVRRDDAVAHPDMKRYATITSSRLAGVFNQQVVNTPDGKYIARPLDALFVCEDEKSCMSMQALWRRNHISHVAAIAYHPEMSWDYYFDRVVANAGKVIVLQDNEPDKDNGKNPGLDRAMKIQGLVRARPAYIIKSPRHKQISDLIKAEGATSAMDWLAGEKACANLFE